MLQEMAYVLRHSVAFGWFCKADCILGMYLLSHRLMLLKGLKGSHREEFGDVSPTQLRSGVVLTSGAYVVFLQSNEPSGATHVV